MNGLTHLNISDSAWLPLLGGAGLLFVASFFALDALAGKTLSPGRRAVAQWIPIATAALAAVFCRRADIAMSIIFSTSVASLSLVLGSIALAEPEAEMPEAWRRVWPFVLPAALLVLLAGFAGRLNFIHAMIFLIEGIVLMGAWQERSKAATEEQAKSVFHDPNHAPPQAKLSRVNITLSATLAIIGAIAAVYGTIKASGDGVRIFSDYMKISAALVVVIFVGPLLVLPMLLSGANIARHGRAWAATTTGVGVVLLNLCLLLPAVILFWYPVSAFRFDLEKWKSLHFDSFTNTVAKLRTMHFDSLKDVNPLVYPMVTWRVDTVILVLLGFVLLPVSLGRWRLGRAEGAVLVGLYAVYILMNTAARMHFGN